VSASAVRPSGALTIGAVGGAALLVLVASLISILTVLIGQSGCPGTQAQAEPSANAEHRIPANYLTHYQRAGRQYGVPWQVLAGIGSIETDHGRSRAPGVRAGVNSYGCCAGPMQFNTRDGPPSTWDRYGVDGNRDGTSDIYDPADAIPSPPTTSARCCATPPATSARRCSATTTPTPTSTTCSRAPAPTRA
jgi:hypothetical protein